MKRQITLIALATLIVCVPQVEGSQTNIIVTAGQSNMVGQGVHNQPYTGNDLLFGNDYVIKAFADRYDSGTGQIDTVSQDSALGGSFLPWVLTYLDPKESSVTFMVVPCPKGQTTMSQWLPGGDIAADRTNRATLYGSMIWRLRQAGTNGAVLCVDFLEGESDAHNGTIQSSMLSMLQQFGDDVWTDAGVPVVVNTLYTLPGETQAHQDSINNAIRASWGTHHILRGADLNIITADDSPHVTTDAGLTWAGGLIATNIDGNFYHIPIVVPTNEVDGTFSASSYDTSPHDWGNTFACYYYCMYPQFTNHIYSWSRSGSSSELDYEAQEEKYCLPFWASFPVPGNNWYLFNDNGGYRSNDVVQWGTNIFAGPMEFWNGTAKTNEGVSTQTITHYAMGCIPHDSSDGDSGAISRNDGSLMLDSIYGTPAVDMWHLLWTNGVSTDQSGSRLFGFDAGGHPSQSGLLCMTLKGLIALHAETNVGAITFNWGADSASTNHCTASSINVSGATLSATVHFDRMPLGWDVPDGIITNDARNAFVVMPELGNAFSWILQVTNLPDGNYSVAIDGSNVVTLSSSQLAAGWNMFTNYTGPLWAQRKEVLGRKRDQEGLDRITLAAHGGGSLGTLSTGDLVNYQGQADLQYVTNGKRGSAYVTSMATLMADMQVYDNAIQAASVQTNHTFTITQLGLRFAPALRAQIQQINLPPLFSISSKTVIEPYGYWVESTDDLSKPEWHKEYSWEQDVLVTNGNQIITNQEIYVHYHSPNCFYRWAAKPMKEIADSGY